MIAIFCGDRNWTNTHIIFKTMQELLPELVGVIQGEARGADSLSKLTAQRLKIRTFNFPAFWETYGKRAGIERNERMLAFLLNHTDRDKRVYAFHNDINTSKGTKHMCRIAEQNGIPVKICSENSEEGREEKCL